jgi:rod shape-determining protein MreD
VRLLILFSIATFIALALQTSLPHLLPLGMFVPDLALILAVDLGLRHHTAIAALLAFGIGYATDAFSGTQLGLNALMLTFVFLMAYWLSRSLISAGTAVGVIAVFVGVIFSDFGSYIASSGWTAPDRVGALMPPVLMQAAITALLSPPVFTIMGWAARMAGLRHRGARE